MRIETLDIALLVVMVGMALWTVMTARLLRSAIALAVTSAVLAVLMYRLLSPIAAVFELSVCAGLIPAIFISAVGMTRRLNGEDLAERQREKWRAFGPLPGLVVLAGVLLAIWQPSLAVNRPVVVDANVGQIEVVRAIDANTGKQFSGKMIDANYIDRNVRDVLWNQRHADLLGQVMVLLAGAFAVVVLVKELRNEH
jgi:NADH-quinone oxidoreductase subunit J